MNDDELDRALHAARPHTAADDGWANTSEAGAVLAAIRQRAATRGPLAGAWRSALRRPRVLGLGIGLAGATAAAVAVGLVISGGPAATPRPPLAAPPTGTGTGRHEPGPVPAHMALVAYSGCDAMLADLRKHTAAHVGAYGLPGSGGYTDLKGVADGTALRGPIAASVPAADGSAPQHSTTNVQEAGVGEPDIVETDGRRVVSVSNGVLRVVDASSRQLTGTLDLSIYAGADTAQLLMSGDRLLVILGSAATPVYYGDLYPGFGGGGGGSTLLLVDLAGAQPAVIGTMHTDGGYLDARMVGDTARVVVRSTPTLSFPQPVRQQTDKQRTERNRDIVRHAPLSAWLPSYQITAGGATTTNTVPCASVSHPVHFTGAAMLTVYTVSLAGDLANPQPVTLAADGTTVYASTSSLYVSSELGTRWNAPAGPGQLRTQLDRFDISAPGKPDYLGSGTVPGALLDSYSMSEYAGALRVVTTDNPYAPSATTSVYALNADTLQVEGHADGLGRGEQVHAVRFLGPLAYVVTYQSVDPLYVVDLRDPSRPREVGALTVTGYSDYLHPVADGRLLGVGESVNGNGIVDGLQVSLFDVSSPADPKRLDRVTQRHSPSETPIDPHAFLYWPARNLAVIPIDSWNPQQSGAALVVRVGAQALTVVGTIRNPAVSTIDSYATGIERTMVIGDELWTMSSSGLQVSDLQSLERRAWVPFQ